MTEPFAWREVGADDGFEGVGGLDRARVVQCALSRICGVCGESLGRPIAFVGTSAEEGRNAFHCPPLHVSCASALTARHDADPGWRLVTTAAYEFVRPATEDADRRPRFEPHRQLS
ncbi:MAG TPA: hypothetical protein VJ872_19475 [Nocardioides sp.]|nr:hypothetical protein [Nocardioides sp.]